MHAKGGSRADSCARVPLQKSAAEAAPQQTTELSFLQTSCEFHRPHTHMTH